MKKKIFIKIFLILIIIVVLLIFFLWKKFSLNKEVSTEDVGKINEIYSSNIIKDVNYEVQDKNGNEYSIYAELGEIDINNRDVIFLNGIKAFIKLKNSNDIQINSDFGKYNINTYETIFSKNVVIIYLNHKITGEYLDFSVLKNLMIISRNVIYQSFNNTLKADVIEIDTKTKDAKIFMYKNDNKINIKSN